MPKEDYTPNSHKYNEMKEQEKESKPETTETKKHHVHENRSIGQRFKEIFFNACIPDVIADAVEKIVIPAVKNIIFDTIVMTVSSILGRDAGKYFDKYAREYEYNTSRTGYHCNSKSRTANRETVRTRPARRFFSEKFEFDTMFEAEDVLRQMNEQCQRFDGVCSISNFYDFVDVDRPDDWMDSRWGWSWRAIDEARIIRTRDGYYAISIREPDTYID